MCRFPGSSVHFLLSSRARDAGSWMPYWQGPQHHDFWQCTSKLGLNFHSPEALLAAVDHFSAYNTATVAGARLLKSHEAHQFSDDPAWLPDNLNHPAIDLTQEDVDVDTFEDKDEDPQYQSELISQDQEDDDPDLFHCPNDFVSEDCDFASQPPHVLAIYAVTAWLHLQFHLPCVACQALLSIFALILLAICPSISTPLVTLHSTNHTLGLDKSIHTLPVCPSCCDVFPPASSLHSQDTHARLVTLVSSSPQRQDVEMLVSTNCW